MAEKEITVNTEDSEQYNTATVIDYDDERIEITVDVEGAEDEGFTRHEYRGAAGNGNTYELLTVDAEGEWDNVSDSDALPSDLSDELEELGYKFN